METKVFFSCNNAPKMARIVDISIAIAERDIEALKPHVRDDFTLSIVGTDLNYTLDELVHELPKDPAVKTIEVTNALSHGNGGMAEGTMERTNGTRYQFCHVARFVNTAKDALVKNVHMYFVQLDTSKK
ncbi:MAG: hypothetical protein QM632_01885 [Micrococcaceae bacterium]